MRAAFTSRDRTLGRAASMPVPARANRRADRRIECIVAEPNGSEDGQEVERPRVERFGSVLCDHKHEPLADPFHLRHRRRDRQHQAAVSRERIEPRVERMRDARVHKDGVEALAQRLGAVAVPNLRPSERRQVALRLLGERLVNFESEHATRGSDDVGHEGRVVAQTAADVKDAMAGFELKRVD